MKVIIDGTIKVLVPDKEFKENWELTSDGYAKPKPIPVKENIEERISKKLKEAHRTKSNFLKRKMAREERKRRRL